MSHCRGDKKEREERKENANQTRVANLSSFEPPSAEKAFLFLRFKGVSVTRQGDNSQHLNSSPVFPSTRSARGFDTSGDTKLGGTDLDIAVVQHLLKEFKKETGMRALIV